MYSYPSVFRNTYQEICLELDGLKKVSISELGNFKRLGIVPSGMRFLYEETIWQLTKKFDQSNFVLFTNQKLDAIKKDLEVSANRYRREKEDIPKNLTFIDSSHLNDISLIENIDAWCIFWVDAHGLLDFPKWHLFNRFKIKNLIYVFTPINGVLKFDPLSAFYHDSIARQMAIMSKQNWDSLPAWSFKKLTT